MAAFDRYLKATFDRATQEARLDGSTTVEAQHLLLAMAADDASAPGRVLASTGLDRGAIRAALDREFEQSLVAAGVAGPALGMPAATPDPERSPHPGESVRLALQRGLAASARRGPQPAHLLLGILRAEHGTVPRALDLAGVDREDLRARVASTVA